MPSVGAQCHELRINDRDQTWRIIYYVASDAVVILDVFSKKMRTTTAHTLETCRKRLAGYLKSTSGKEHT